MLLFVVPGEMHARRAYENLARVCEEELEGRCELTLVDVIEDFETATEYDVMVTPTLIVEGRSEVSQSSEILATPTVCARL